MRLPSLALPATSGSPVDLSAITGIAVVFVYPMTGRPGVVLPDGWDQIPGARGCTPQACAYRDQSEELRRLGVQAVYGLSAQDTAYQREAAERLHLPFPLLSDSELKFAKTVGLPLFTVAGLTLIRRVTFISSRGIIRKVFYPVFPPDQNASAVVAWLGTEGGETLRRSAVWSIP